MLTCKSYVSAAALCFFYCCCSPLPTALALLTHPSQVFALEAVANSLIDDHNNLKGWNKGDPCISNWTGVLCFDAPAADGYFGVRELYPHFPPTFFFNYSSRPALTCLISPCRLLMNMNLSGTLAPELGQLSQLRILNFMWNELTGTIPKEIANITSLRLLLLNGNQLSGSLPNELGYLANLDRFQIDQNQLSGPIPKSFSNLNSIKHIHFNNNSLSGLIPSELSNLSTLIHLLLDNNNLSGNLPTEFSNFPVLQILQLDNNNFSGSEIPASYGNLSRLVKLSLRNCCLKGPIPDLSRMPNLTYLDLSWNQLSGTLPMNDLSNNMTTIVLSGNQLKGSIPESFSHLPSLQKLFLGNNFLTGSVTVDLWQNKSFSSTARLLIDLANNSLSNVTGDIDPPVNVTLSLSKGILIAVILTAVVVAVVISTTVTVLITKRHAGYQLGLSRKQLSSKLLIKIDDVKSFTFEELASATNHFSESTQIGQGGYGTVYKDALADKTVVAIKRAKEGSLQGQKEFLTEIEFLSRLHHRNLVALLGYCDEEGEQMLVYEFMPNGTLRDWLSAKSGETLNFGARLHIALGAAKGILYLHTEAHPPIFHRDIKASNILLDSKLTAKVADFGLSRLAPVLDGEEDVPEHVSTIVKGTPVSLHYLPILELQHPIIVPRHSHL